jgi:hypothetical protein
VDFLHIDTIAFPVLRGVLCKLDHEPNDGCWHFGLLCGKSAHWNNPNCGVRPGLEGITAAEPYLHSRTLPLRALSPDELVGQRYEGSQDGEPAPGEVGLLLLSEHGRVWPLTVAFTAKRGRQYRVEIAGKHAVNGTSCDLRVEAWFDLEEWTGGQ